MSHSLWCMPLVTINLGGEMIYILHQRLKAQKVPADKEARVLREVIKAMFTPEFVTELFCPQTMYSAASTRQIFDKLAHSSLMRLNKTSMDKLYDLMIMGFKHQIVNCSHPRQYLHMTLLHMEAMRIIVGSSTDPECATARSLLDNTEQQLVALYGPCGACSTEGQLILLKQSLSRFVQGKKIKASLFLQNNIQGMDGMFILSLLGSLPYGTEVPGAGRILAGKDGSSRLIKSYAAAATTSSTAQGQDKAKLHSALNVVPVDVPFATNFLLGTNMYTMNNSVLCAENAEDDSMAIFKCLQRLENIYSVGRNRASAGIGKGIGIGIGIGTSMDAGGKGSVGVGQGKKIDAVSAKAERSMNQSLLGGAGSKSTSTSASSSSSSSSGSKVNLSALLPVRNSSGIRGRVEDELDIDVSGEMMEINAQADAKTLQSMITELDLDSSADAKSNSRNGNANSHASGMGMGMSVNYAAQAKGTSTSTSSSIRGAKGDEQQQPQQQDDEDDEDDLLALMDMAK